MKPIKLNSVLFLLFLSITFSACSILKKGDKKERGTSATSTKPVDFKSMTEMVFGWGGGFTGMVDEYRLAKDGTLMQGDEMKKKVDPKTMKMILGLFKKINFTKTKLNDPGNLYYFIAAKAGNNEQKLIWNDQTQLPLEVKAAYDELIKLTK